VWYDHDLGFDQLNLGYSTHAERFRISSSSVNDDNLLTLLARNNA